VLNSSGFGARRSSGSRRRLWAHPGRDLGLVAAALTAAAGMSACSSNHSGSPGTSSTTTSGATSTSTSSTTTTTGASGDLACPASALEMSVAGTQGAAGTLELTFALRNSSSSTCPMNGFPGGQLLDSSGTQLPTDVVRGGSYPFTSLPPSLVNLAPGATAYFNMGYSDVPTGSETSCPAATQIEVTPPNAVDHDVIAVQITACDAGKLTVSPVFATGSPSSHTTAPPQP